MANKKMIALAAASAILSAMAAALPFASAAGTPVITFDSVDVNPGTQAVVPVYLEQNSGIDGYAFEILYDTSAMTLAEIVEGDCPVKVLEGDADNSFIFGQNFDSVYTEEEALLCELVFDVSANAEIGEYMLNINSCGVSLNDAMIDTDITPGSVNVTDEDLAGIINGLYTPSPTIIAGKIYANPGTTVYLPVSVKNNSSFDALELTLTYDSQYFTYTEASDGIAAPTVNAADGTLTYKIAGDITDSDVLSYLSFKVNAGTPVGEYPVTLSVKALTLDGKAVEYNQVSGKITVTEGEIEESEGDGVYNNQLYYRVYSDHVAITGYESVYGEDDTVITDVIIPETIDDLPVTEIEEWAFSYEDEITSVSLPSTLTKIGDGAFLFCSGITSVEIPSSVTTIGDDAFNMCTSVPAFTIPAKTTSIGVNAFLDCQSVAIAAGNTAFVMDKGVLMNAAKTRVLQATDRTLASYSVPSTVKDIDMYAFYNMPALTKVVLPETLTAINESVFLGATLLADVNLPDSLTTIGVDAFSGTALTEVTIPAGVTEIGIGAFGCCDAMTAINVAAGNTAYMSEEGILFNKSGTTLIKAPAAMELGEYVTPDTVKVIEESAFDYNASLTSVTIPEGVTDIGACAFESCANLKSVKFMGMGSTVGGMEYSISNSDTEEGEAVFEGVIYGYAGCNAQDYANDYGYQFELIAPATDLAGDANGDGKVNMIDAVLVSKYLLAQKQNLISKNADLVNDEVINGFDLGVLKKMLLEK
ncbi:MAG: leucine-rich repeat protein [Oscillospiraceae bacterium]|nr:leucine-rich repeat protein [Oscillospiraceae bacterium]